LNNEELRACASAEASAARPVLKVGHNPGLKSGVIDNELIVDFSPKYVF